MFDIGWTEMMVVAVVAILFVGPKELPGMLRTFGKAIKKIRGLAGDFQQQFDDALKDAELDGVKDTINDVRNLDPTKAIKDKLNPLKDDVNKIGQSTGAVTADDDKHFAEFDSAVESEGSGLAEAVAEQQKKIDEDFAKVAPSSGANAVPGFGGPKADPLPAEKPVAAKTKIASKSSAKKTAAKKPALKKAVTKKPATKTAAAKKPAEKKIAAKASSSKASASKTKAASTKKPVTKRKTAKKAEA